MVSGLLQFPPEKEVLVKQLLTNLSGKTAVVDVKRLDSQRIGYLIFW